MSEVEIDPETEAQIIAAIHKMDARDYGGSLRISKIAKEFNSEVELVTEVVRRLIEREIAFRHPTSHKDEFTIRAKQPPANYLGS